jgi:hypothetical protein
MREESYKYSIIFFKKINTFRIHIFFTGIRSTEPLNLVRGSILTSIGFSPSDCNCGGSNCNSPYQIKRQSLSICKYM